MYIYIYIYIYTTQRLGSAWARCRRCETLQREPPLQIPTDLAVQAEHWMRRASRSREACREIRASRDRGWSLYIYIYIYICVYIYIYI